MCELYADGSRNHRWAIATEGGWCQTQFCHPTAKTSSDELVVIEVDRNRTVSAHSLQIM